MPMLVGIIYGLTFQGLALSRLGRHDEAIAATDEAVALLERQRAPRAPSTSSAGTRRSRPPPAAPPTRAPHCARAAAEVDAKAARLRDPELRELFLASRTPKAVRAALGHD